MTQRSQAERSRAFRLRQKVATSKAISDTDRAWLSEYDSDSPPVIAEDASIVSETPLNPSNAAPAQQALPDGHITLDFGAPAESVSIAPAQSCTIPNCPKCKALSGSVGNCGVTGEVVWPPIQAESAEAMAATLMGGIAFVARVMRKDKAFILPTEAERKMLGKALQTTLNRRFNQAGAIDDIFFLMFALIGYGQRAFTAEAPKEIPPNAPR